MSRTFHHGERRDRLRSVRRDDPALRKLARALIDLAQAQAEAEARESRAPGDSRVALARKKSAKSRKDAA